MESSVHDNKGTQSSLRLYTRSDNNRGETMKAVVMGAGETDCNKEALATALAHKWSHVSNVHIVKAKSRDDLKALTGHNDWIVICIGYIQFTYESIVKYCNAGDEVQMIYLQPITIHKIGTTPYFTTDSTYQLLSNIAHDEDKQGFIYKPIDSPEGLVELHQVNGSDIWSGSIERAKYRFTRVK